MGVFPLMEHISLIIHMNMLNASHWMFTALSMMVYFTMAHRGCGLLAWKDSNGPTAHMPALYLHRAVTKLKPSSFPLL